MAEQSEYSKELFRNRKKQYRSRHRSVTLSFPMDVAKNVEAKATNHGKTLPDFIKSLIAANLEGTGYVLPKDNNIQTLIIELRRIGTNVNQLVRHINSVRDISQTDITQMQKHLLEVEQQVKAALMKPQSFQDFISDYLKKHPEHLQALIDFLNDYQSNSR
ncbi:MAG: plasmid mobilization relaxosome protein MobC [Bacteroidia bacterium]